MTASADLVSMNNDEHSLVILEACHCQVITLMDDL